MSGHVESADPYIPCGSYAGKAKCSTLQRLGPTTPSIYSTPLVGNDDFPGHVGLCRYCRSRSAGWVPLVEGKQELLIAAVVAALHTLASHFLFSVVAPEPHFFLSVEVRGELDQDWHKLH